MKSKATPDVPAILRDWETFVGTADSTYVTPMISSGGYTYIAAQNVDSLTGPDIVIKKINEEKTTEWEVVWSGPAYGRDQITSMAEDDDFIYACGATHSTTTNFDFIIMKIAKVDGNTVWIQTYDGPSSNYDIATAIFVYDDNVYVTGASFSTTTLVDYHTIKYTIDGVLVWENTFDYNNLMDVPIGISVDENTKNIAIVGGSQANLLDWDYQTVILDDSGSVIDQNRVSGSSAGFDHATAIKVDGDGNFYITGGTYEGSSNYNIKTVKFDRVGNFVWENDYDSGGDDLATDMVINNGSVYVCGTALGNGQDFFAMSITADSGFTNWTYMFEGKLGDDTARAICVDSYGEIVVVGQVGNIVTDNYDFFTVGLNSNEGHELWSEFFDGEYHGNDNATNVVSDGQGNIYVTGQEWTPEMMRTKTIKYKMEYFTEPPPQDSVSQACLFYPNSGQITDVNDSSVTDSLHYYTIHHTPQLYFGFGVMNMVFSHIDTDTTSNDSLQRVDVTFLNSTNETEAYPLNEQDSSGYMNYYLAQCPSGITEVFGNGGLLYTDVYPDIDAIYSSNEGGLKLTFVCNPGSNPAEIGLSFEGLSSLSVSQNWSLDLHTLVGDYSFERPRVYQVDTDGTRIPLFWAPTWSVSGEEATLASWGSIRSDIPLMIEIARQSSGCPNPPDPNLMWSTYFGGTMSDEIADMTSDQNGKFDIAGHTSSPDIPTVTGVQVFQITNNGVEDAFASQFNSDNSLAWTTYLGGSSNDFGKGITVDSQGKIYVVGQTQSGDFVTTNPGGGAEFHNVLSGGYDGFIFQLTNLGLQTSTEWSTFFGGIGQDEFLKCKIDGSDNLFVVGNTGRFGSERESPVIPTPSTQPSGAFVQHGYIPSIFCFTTNGDGTITTASTADIKVGSTVVGPGILSGAIVLSKTSTSFEVDPLLVVSTGSIIPSFFKGDEGIIVKFNSSHQLVWSTHVCGNDNEGITDISIDNSDNVFVTGTTTSDDFPTLDPSPGNDFCNTSMSGIGDAFIMKFGNSGSLLWSSYYGGTGDESFRSGLDWLGAQNLFGTVVGGSIYANAQGDIFVAGATNSTDNNGLLLQSFGSALQHTNTGGTDAFIARFSSSLVRTWGTYFGGSGSEWINDLDGPSGSSEVFLVGTATASSSTPFTAGSGLFTQANHGHFDGFVVDFSDGGIQIWGTFLGGNQDDDAVTCLYDQTGIPKLRMAGEVTSSNWNVIASTGEFRQCLPASAVDNFISTFTAPNFVISTPILPPAEGNFIVYPSPANNFIHLQFGGDLIGQVEIEVIDNLGQRISVYKTLMSSANLNYGIDVENYPSGVYIIRVKNRDKVSVGRFIKQ